MIRYTCNFIIFCCKGYYSGLRILIEVAVACSLLYLLSVLRCLFSSLLHVASGPSSAGRADTYQNVEKKGRSQRILLHTCWEIVYSVVAQWKKLKGTKNAEYIVRISDNFYFPHVIIIHVVSLYILYTHSHISPQWKCWIRVKPWRTTLVSKWKHINSFWAQCNCKRKVRMIRTLKKYTWWQKRIILSEWNLSNNEYLKKYLSFSHEAFSNSRENIFFFF